MNRRRLLVAALLAAAPLCAPAQQPYPNRPIRMVVVFAPGGGSDLVARKLAERLQPRLGQPVVIENRPGAGGAIGAQAVSQSEPDGYSLLVAGGSMTALKALNPQVTVDVQKDFAAVARFAETISVLLTNAKFPATTLAEFIAQAKANPGKYNYGHPGGTVELGFEQLLRMTGTRMVGVQYKGEADYMTALLGDQVQLTLSNIATAMPQADAGKVRILAVTAKTRSALLPSVPTADEAGARGWDYSNASGILAPSRTPQAVVDRLAQEILSIARSDEYREDTLKWSKGGYQPSPAGAQEYAAQIAAEVRAWEVIAKSVKK